MLRLVSYDYNMMSHMELLLQRLLYIQRPRQERLRRRWWRNWL